MSYIKNAVKTSVITPLTMALVLAISGVTGYLVKRSTTVETPGKLAAMAEEHQEAVDLVRYTAADHVEESFFSLQNPILLVLLGCVLTVVILGIYSYVKNR